MILYERSWIRSILANKNGKSVAKPAHETQKDILEKRNENGPDMKNSDKGSMPQKKSDMSLKKSLDSGRSTAI